jgi:GT2 family glycosyltransferase
MADPARPEQVIVVDNASTDDTTTVVRRFGVELIESEENLGFAGGCNLGASSATEPVLVFLGHDTEPRPGWLPPLVAALEDRSVGIAMATIEDASQPGRYNTSGGHLTYFGLAWVSDSGESIAGQDRPLDVDFPSGAAMAVRRETWEALGGFRAAFFMYHEDSDLGWRARLAGLRVVRVPASLVTHRYEFGRHGEKMMWLERNRLLMLMANYRTRTLLVLLPALVLVELGVVLTAIRHGWLRAKLRSWRALWRARGHLAEWRAQTNRIRRVSDGVMLESLDHRISTAPQMAPRSGGRMIDAVLGGYKRLALQVVRFLDRVA